MVSPVESLVEALPLRQRLALAYAPRGSRMAVLALLALDARLAGIIRQSREPLLAQLRLAWWREQLGADPSAWPEGEPVLAALRSWEGRHRVLLALVDGWEAMAGEAPLPPEAFAALAEARGEGFAALAAEGTASAAALRMGRAWALADLAARVSDAGERAAVLGLVRARDCSPARLPRALRPLAVLHGLAARDLRAAAKDDRLSPAGLVAALRIGIIGR